MFFSLPPGSFSIFRAFFVSNTPQGASPQEHGVDVEYFVIFANVTDSNGMVAAFKRFPASVTAVVYA